MATLLLSAAVVVATAGGGSSSSSSPSSSSPSSATSAAVSTTIPPPTTSTLALVSFPGGATYVTGRTEHFTLDKGTVTIDASGVTHGRNGTVDYDLVSADPRVTGHVTGTYNADLWGKLTDDAIDGVMTQWGTATLTNDGGTWSGVYAGAYASPVGDVITRWWRGAGGYEGLTFYMLIDGSKPGVPVFDWKGIIIPADPPPDATG
jgi:hypothetical protein